MSESGAVHDPLACQALLYAGGELPPAEAAAFEQRLANDQAARDALVLAVGLARPLDGRPATPDPAYRDRVRKRLGAGRGLAGLLGLRTYHGHPLLWAALGAVAAAVVVAVLLPRPAAEVVVVSAAPPGANPAEPPLALPDDDPSAFDVARTWAEIPKGDHLARAREEEIRRKVRAEDRARAAGGEGRRDRPLSNTNPRR